MLPFHSVFKFAVCRVHARQEHVLDDWIWPSSASVSPVKPSSPEISAADSVDAQCAHLARRRRWQAQYNCKLRKQPPDNPTLALLVIVRVIDRSGALPRGQDGAGLQHGMFVVLQLLRYCCWGVSATYLDSSRDPCII
jgi:hypothetical protein